VLEVRIGKVVFYGGAPPKGVGHLIDPDGFGSGWTSGTDVRRDEAVIPQGHGSFDVPGFLSSRVVPISGVTLADSPERLKWLGMQLTGLLADGSLGRIQVKQAGSTEWAPCRLAGKTQFQVNGATETDATFQIQVWCPSPLRFGETRHFAGGVAAYHYGNFAAAPVIYVRATSTMSGGYTLNGPAGKKYIVSASLAAGHLHTIDMSTGLLYVDGADNATFGVVAQGDTWAVPPGQSVAVTLTAGSGAGTLDVAVTDTYV
jgi:hypothetical protein